MFKITSKAKHGGFWDGSRVVKTIETEDATVAEKFKTQGHTVETVEVALEKMNVAQLKKYAKDNDIDLGDATKKEEILAVIEAAQKG